MIKKEIEPVLLFLSALVVFGTLILFGIIYTFFKSIYECFTWRFWKGIIKFIKYWLNVIYQLWNVIKYFLVKFAISLDYIGNITGGELIEDFVTAKENTLYGKGNWTISAATGKLEINNELNFKGRNFSSLLDKILGKNHCIESYKKEI